MSEPTPPRDSARETRLLLLTLGVSVVALLLLARFRFPETPIADLPSRQPLARLAMGNAFNELSLALGDLLRQVDASVVMVRVGPLGDVPFDQWPRTPAGPVTFVPALRMREDLALAYVPRLGRPEAIAGRPAGADTVVARDEGRGIAVVRVPREAPPALSIRPQSNPLDAPGYVAVLEMAQDGPTVRAEFVSRYTVQRHPGWDMPLVTLAGPLRAHPGALVFTLNGSLVGMVLTDGERTVVAPSEVLMTRANRLASGENVRLIDPGVGVQPLTPALAKATGVLGGDTAPRASAGNDAGAWGRGIRGGVIVNVVRLSPAIRNGGTLEVGDVVTAVDGRSIGSPDAWLEALRTRAGAGVTTVKLAIVRQGKPTHVSLALPRTGTGATAADVGTTGTGAAASPAAATDVLGLSLRPSLGGSGVDVTAVRASTPGARAGLRAGDRILSLPGQGTGAASASAILAAYTALGAGGALLVNVEREGAPFLTAIEKP